MSQTIEKNDGAVDGDPNAVQESQIRKMTRLAIEYKAVNLSQGASVCVFLSGIGRRLRIILLDVVPCSNRCDSTSPQNHLLTCYFLFGTKVSQTNLRHGV